MSRSVRIAVFTALSWLLVAACNSEPTAPSRALDSADISAQFSFTGGSGTLLASTDSGELVRVNLDTDEATLIGRGGEHWRDLEFGNADSLWVTGWDNGSWTKLYRVDPEDGAVLDDLGVYAFTEVADLAFRNDTLLVNACCSRIFGWIDQSVPDLVWKGPVNGFEDPINNSLLEEGGLAVHPNTGAVWGVEETLGQPRNIYRINLSTNTPDSIVRLGLNGSTITFGFDGLYILDDGTFLGTRGESAPSADSLLYEINPSRDPTSGLAEVAPFALTIDPAIKGKINGFAVDPFGEPVTTGVDMEATVTTLRPAIRTGSVAGEAATLTVTALVDEAPAEGETITVRAELVSASGGHSHGTGQHSFSDLPDVPSATWTTVAGTPVAGHFRQGSTLTESAELTTNASGIATIEFVAGYLGAKVVIIAEWDTGTEIFADTIEINVRVPGLVPLQDEEVNAYFVGGTAGHPQDSNWYVHPDVVAPLGNLASSLTTEIGGSPAFLQYNDASLEWGGAFTGDFANLLAIAGSSATVDDPAGSHASHAQGIDIDVGFCYALDSGVDENQENRVNFREPEPSEPKACLVGGVPTPARELNRRIALRIMSTYGDTEMHNGDPEDLEDPDHNHFHIRFGWVQ